MIILKTIVYFPTNNIGKYERYKKSFENNNITYNRYLKDQNGNDIIVNVIENANSTKENAKKEVECGQLESSLSSASKGLNYAEGKGRGWERNVNYASSQVSTIKTEYQTN